MVKMVALVPLCIDILFSFCDWYCGVFLSTNYNNNGCTSHLSSLASHLSLSQFLVSICTNKLVGVVMPRVLNGQKTAQ